MEIPGTISPIEPYGQGRGFIDHLQPAAPAAGSGAVIKLDSTYLWRPLSLRFQLDTSAAVANRWPSVDYCDPDGNIYVRNAMAKVFAASTVAQVLDFNAQRGAGEWVAGADVLAPLCDFWLPPGFQIQVNVANIQAADTITKLFLYAEKWVTGRSVNLGGGAQIPAPAPRR